IDLYRIPSDRSRAVISRFASSTVVPSRPAIRFARTASGASISTFRHGIFSFASKYAWMRPSTTTSRPFATCARISERTALSKARSRLGSRSAARPRASRLNPRSFAMARNRVPAETRRAPRASPHRSATVVLPLPGGPPITRIIDVPQAVSSGPATERDAHRLKPASETEVLEDPHDDLPEREREQRIQEDPRREHVHGVHEHVARPGHGDPLVPESLEDDVDEEAEPREDHDEHEHRPSHRLHRRGLDLHRVLHEALLRLLELREPRLLAFPQRLHLLLAPGGHDLLGAGHLHPIRVVVPDDRADRGRQQAGEEDREDGERPPEAEHRE